MPFFKPLAILFSWLFIFSHSMQARAQGDFPKKPVKMIVGYSAGGPTDVVARLIAQDLSTAFGQSVLIENKTGTNGNIATESVASAAPDGYTLIVNTLSHNVNAILGVGKMKYDPFKDFAPVTLAVTLPQYLVVGYNSPYKTMADLIAKSQISARCGELRVSGQWRLCALVRRIALHPLPDTNAAYSL